MGDICLAAERSGSRGRRPVLTVTKLQARGRRIVNWIRVEDELPNNGEFVIGIRADGWWDRIQWTESHGWYHFSGVVQPIVKWCRVVA